MTTTTMMHQPQGTGEKGVRFFPASNAGMGWHDSQWYVLDGLTTEAVEENPNKGWYNTEAQCQKHCDRLNEAEEKAGRFYERLDNGYVREMVTDVEITKAQNRLFA